MAPIEVRNPRTGAIDHRFSPPTAEELAATVAATRQAQREWAARPLAERVAVILRFREALLERRDEVQRALSVDTGRWLLAGGAGIEREHR